MASVYSSAFAPPTTNKIGAMGAMVSAYFSMTLFLTYLGTVYSNMYPELCKHAQSHLVYFPNNLGTMHFNAYPELHKHARSVLVYLLHNLGTGTYTN